MEAQIIGATYDETCGMVFTPTRLTTLVATYIEAFTVTVAVRETTNNTIKK